MAHEVIMPQMGESIAEGTVTTWLKKVGEQVQRDEPLFEISTDKVDAEIPAPVSGTLLEIKVQPGKTVPINTVVALIADGEARAAAKPAAAEAPKAAAPAPAARAEAPRPTPAPAPAARPSGNGAGASAEERRRIKSSPLVRKIAAEHNVDIAQLQGTGISGRVTKNDILGFLEQGGAPAPARPAMPAARAPSMPSVPSEIPASYRPQVFDGDRVEELTAMRAKIAEHMVMSKRISAHVQTVFDCDYSRVDKLRQKHKTVWEERHGVKLTYTAFVAKAVVDALKAFPVLNAGLDENRIIYHRDVNLGIAVALEWGLIVPVIHKANELNLLGLARRIQDLGTRARDKKLKPGEVQRGTFTITNPGSFGNVFGLPIINQPQVAIFGMGGIEKRPVVIDDMIGIRTRGYTSLSFDHRLVDGAVADQFMARVKKILAEFDEAEL